MPQSLNEQDIEQNCKNAQNPVISVFNNSYDAPKITVRKFHPKVLDEVSIELDKFDFQTWHSYCFVFDTQHQFPYPGGYTNLTNRAYVDGKLVGSGKSSLYDKHCQRITERCYV